MRRAVRVVEVTEERREAGDFAPRIINWAGAYAILFIGLAHVLIVGEHFLTATYLGLLFLANFFGSLAVAVGLFLGRYTWAWLLGDLIAGGSFVGFVVSRAIGLPGVDEFVGKWFSIAGLLTVGLDGLFLTLSLLVITPQGRAVLRIEERRIEAERLPPARQDTPEHRREIEERMEEVRTRMAPDLVDLRQHVEPQTLAEVAKRSLRQLLRSVTRSTAGVVRSKSVLPLAIVLVTILVARRTNGGDERRVKIRPW